MTEDELSTRIVRACIEAGVNPAISDLPDDGGAGVRYGPLPENCPVPEMQIYSVRRWNATEHEPECWSIMVMLEQQIGSMCYWIPLEISGPNLHRDWRDGSSPRGWKISFWEKSASYADLRALEKGWWPTLEEAWKAIPEPYLYYFREWREHGDCQTCMCTGVLLRNLIVLPCPHCRTTPYLTYGWLGLMWVPAHTAERLPHAEVGKRWRWKYGEGYVVERVIGDPEMVEKYPGLEFVHVGLRRHEAVADPNWKFTSERVDPGWGDYDAGDEGRPSVLVSPPRRGGIAQLRRRVAGWFDPRAPVEG